MKYVIIGAGAAGISAAEKIIELDSRGEVILISTDEVVYSRCMLHHVISGGRTVESISFIDKDFFGVHPIQWIKGRTVKGINFNDRKITLDDGASVAYDKLLIAAGSKASIPPVKGFTGAANVFTLRDIEDVERINKAVAVSKNAVVLGAGLVGLDAAMALLERGLQVTIVEMANRMLPLQLDARASQNYQEAFEKAGAAVFTWVSATEGVKDANDMVHSLVLSDGTVLPCDMVVAAAGVRPNLEFIKANDLEIDRGIKVNSCMQTSVPHVFAAGDITGLSAIWPSAVKQGIIAAYNMTGHDKQYTDYFTAKNSISLLGLETVSVGLPEAPDSSYSVDIFLKDGVYKKLIYKDNVVYGVILQKDIARSGFWTHVIKEKEKIDMSGKNKFNLSYADFFQIDSAGNYKYATV